MKYYIYISDTKIEMLYPQKPQSLLKRIASTLSIDLKLFGAEVSVASKSNQSDQTRYSKVKSVSEYIEKHFNVGTVEAPAAYFKGSLPMDWGLLNNMINQPPYAVYFGGSTDLTLLGMIGSVTNIVGNKSDASKSNFTLYYTPDEIVKALANDTKLPQPYDLSAIVRQATPPKEKQIQRLEFLAKTIVNTKSEAAGKELNVLLGTPIYVALAD